MEKECLVRKVREIMFQRVRVGVEPVFLNRYETQNRGDHKSNDHGRHL
jgi:hypothetical protein